VQSVGTYAVCDLSVYLFYANFQIDEGGEGEGVADDEEGDDIEVRFALS